MKSFIIILLIFLFIYRNAESFQGKLNFGKRLTDDDVKVNPSPNIAGPLSIYDNHSYIGQPYNYDNQLFNVLKTISNPELDFPDMSLKPPVNIKNTELNKINTFLKETINNEMKTQGTFSIIDLTGKINRGIKVNYYQLNANLLNHPRSSVTPVIVELYKVDNEYKLKLIKVTSEYKPAYSTYTYTKNVSSTKYASDITYPDSLKPLINQYEAQDKEDDKPTTSEVNYGSITNLPSSSINATSDIKGLLSRYYSS